MQSGGVPELASCVDPRGPINVFPGSESVCQQLGLQSADPDLTPANEAVVQLQDRLAQEVNLAECRPVSDVAAAATGFVSEAGLEGWQVVVTAGDETGECGKAAVDSNTQTVSIFNEP